MPAVAIGLWCVAAFLLIGALGIVAGRLSYAAPLIYGLALAVSLVALGLGLDVLLRSAEASTVVLPLGLPGPARISGWTRCRPFFCLSLISEAPPRAFMELATADPSRRRCVCFPITARSSPG